MNFPTSLHILVCFLTDVIPNEMYLNIILNAIISDRLLGYKAYNKLAFYTLNQL
jgi:hypothetical protein